MQLKSNFEHNGYNYGIPLSASNPIGCGADSEIFHLKNDSLSRFEAWKVFRKIFEETDEGNYLSKATTLSGIGDCENIPGFYHSGICEDEEGKTHYYIAMQYINGETLDVFIDKHLETDDASLPFPVALDLAKQICNALAFARNKQINHCDINPQNIIVETNSQGKFRAFVLDFSQQKENRLVHAGLLPPDPERAELSRDDFDVYAVCAIIFRLFGKRKDFHFTENIFPSAQFCIKVITDILSQNKKIDEKNNGNTKNTPKNTIELLEYLDQWERTEAKKAKMRYLASFGIVLVTSLIIVLLFVFWTEIQKKRVETVIAEKVGEESVKDPGILRGFLDVNFGVPLRDEKSGVIRFWLGGGELELKKGWLLQIGYDPLSPYNLPQGKDAPEFAFSMLTSKGWAYFVHGKKEISKKDGPVVYLENMGGYFQAQIPIGGKLLLFASDKDEIPKFPACKPGSKNTEVSEEKKPVLFDPGFSSLRILQTKPLKNTVELHSPDMPLLQTCALNSARPYNHGVAWSVAEIDARKVLLAKGSTLRLRYYENSVYAKGPGPNFLLRFETDRGLLFFTNSAFVARQHGQAVLMDKKDGYFEARCPTWGKVNDAGMMGNDGMPVVMDFGMLSVFFLDGSQNLNADNKEYLGISALKIIAPNNASAVIEPSGPDSSFLP